MIARNATRFCIFKPFCYSIFCNVASFLQSNVWPKRVHLSKVNIRPEVMDYVAQVIDMEKDRFQFGELGERVYDMEHAELAARCLAAGGQQGKVVIRMKPFSKICPISTHVNCN